MMCTSVDVEELGLPREQRGVRDRAGEHCQKLQGRDVSVIAVEVGVFWGVAPAECSPYRRCWDHGAESTVLGVGVDSK